MTTETLTTAAELAENRRLQAVDAEAKSASWLGNGNAAAERGNLERAERCYEKAGYWLDRANRLRGYGDGSR